MPDRKPNRSATSGNTIPVQGEKQERSPRLPHERDESSDSQVSAEPTAQRMGTIAHDDLEHGRVDTDKGPVIDATYERYRTGGGPGDKKRSR